MALIDVVKYNGGPDVFAWKYPNESLGNWTQVIVNETQEAVIFKSGMALDVLGSGRHTLDTANMPIMSKLINLPFGGRSPFSAEIWYVNKAYTLDVKWGTATPIQIQDPKYNIFVPVRSNGIFGIRIIESKKFLCKLVGTLPIFDRVNVSNFFRGLIITKAKDIISSYVIKKGISLLEINAYIDEVSNCIKEQCQNILSEYGIQLVNFYVNDVSVPENDPGVQKLKGALARKAEMDIIGYDYQQQRSFDTLEGVAKNPGTGATPIMGVGVGMGVGMGMGGPIHQAFHNMAQGMNFSNPISSANVQEREGKAQNTGKIVYCENCQAVIPKDSKFCAECGKKYNPCPKCGADLKEEAKQCQTCGYELPRKCSKCGIMVDKGKKYCPECGNFLVKKCPKCDTILDENASFCVECGEKLEENK